MSIFFLTYSYFGTQLVWAAVFLSLLFGVIVDGFKDLREAIGLWKQHLAYSLSVILILVATVSTVMQFWQTIISFFCYKMIAGLEAYWVLLILAALVASSLFARHLYLRKKEKTRLRKLEEKKAAEQKEAETIREQEKVAVEKAVNERKLKIADILKQNGLSVEDLSFLINNRSHFSDMTLDESSLLVKINMRQYFTICHSKNQIVFHHSIKEVLFWLNSLYIRSYKDTDIKIIKEKVSSLSDYLTQYQHFIGYQAFCDLLDASLDPALRLSF
jgi:hypothetical protein